LRAGAIAVELMFLFLSKLLPIFFYPLGLACVAMALGLLWLWKRPRWVSGAIAKRILGAILTVGLVGLLLGSNGWVSNGLLRSLEWQNIPDGELPNASAIVVLGGGIKAANYPRPWVDVSEAGDRVLHGARLYLAGKAPIVIPSGGRIDWRGGGPPESEAMAEILRAMGVPQGAIVEEPDSLNTYENAANVAEILRRDGIDGPVLLVTSASHMPRSLLCFAKQGVEAIAAPTDFIVSEQELAELSHSWQSVLLNLLPDSGRLENTTKALKEYLGLAIYRLRGWI